MSGEVCNSPPPKRARAEEAEAAEWEGEEVEFVDLPAELQQKIFELVYNEQGVSLKETVKRVGTIRLLCSCTSSCACLVQATCAFEREFQRREEFREEFRKTLSEESELMGQQKAKDLAVKVVFVHTTEGTDGASALKGLRAWAKLNDMEERYLNKCRNHFAAGNRSLTDLPFD